MMYKIMFWLGLAVAAILVISNMAASTGFAYIGNKNMLVWQIMVIIFIVGVIVGVGLPKAFNKNNVSQSEEDDLFFN